VISTGKDALGLHLASYRTSEQADSALKKIHEKFPGLGDQRQVFIKQVDLGAKGIWYRVLAGGFKNREDLSATIQELSSKHQYAEPMKF